MAHDALQRGRVERARSAVCRVPRGEDERKGAVDPLPLADEHRREHWREGERHEERGERRRRDHDGEGDEEMARQRLHRRDRQEHDDVGERRGADRDCDLSGGRGDDLLGRTSLPFGHAGGDVLQHDDRVRDEDSGRNAHGAHRDEVERAVEEGEHDERDHHRDRYRDERHERARPFGEEENEDDARQQDALPYRVEAPAHRRVDVRAVVAHPVERHARRKRLARLLRRRAHEVHHGRGVRLAFLRDLDDHRRLAVEESKRLDALAAEAERGDVAEIDAATARAAQFDCAELVRLLRLGVERDRRAPPGFVHFAGRNLDISLADLVHHLGEGEPLCREPPPVHLDDDFALLAADQLHRRDAGKRREPACELVVGVVVQIAVRGGVARGRGQRHRDDGRRVYVVLRDVRLLGAGGQVVHDEVDLLAHVGRHHVHVAVEVEFEHHLAEVVGACGGHVLEAVDLAHRVLDLARDGRFDLLRRRAWIDHRDGDVRDVDERK